MTILHRIPGAVLTEREHTVPLNHEAPDGRTHTVFTREVAAPEAPTGPTWCSSTFPWGAICASPFDRPDVT